MVMKSILYNVLTLSLRASDPKWDQLTQINGDEKYKCNLIPLHKERAHFFRAVM